MTVNANNTTLFMPVKDNSEFALRSIQYLVETSPCKKMVVAYEDGTPDDYIKHEKIKYYKNTGGRCYSKIHNEGIRNIETENLIFVAWRSRPKVEHFEKMFDLLSIGYAVADLQLMHFTALGKPLLEKIGWFDEGYIFGHCEDWDFYNRLIMSNYAVYVTNEIEEEAKETCWSASEKIGPFNADNYKYYKSKWKLVDRELMLIKNEINYKDRQYYKGQFEQRNYLDSSKSIIGDHWAKSQHFDAIDKVSDCTKLSFSF